MWSLWVVAKHSALQFTYFFGAFGLGALALTVLSKATNKLLVAINCRTVRVYFFELVGVPVHEFSHVFFCKLFGHEVTMVKWFDPNGKNGASGAVQHQFNPWNPYHRIGQFFIGLAPVIAAPFILAILLRVFIPSSQGPLERVLQFAAVPSEQFLPAYAPLCNLFFSHETYQSWKFWLFFAIASAVVSQIELSKADLLQALSGTFALFALCLCFNFVCKVFNLTIQAKIEAVGRTFFLGVCSLFTLAIAVSLLNLALLFAIRQIQITAGKK